MKKLLYCLISLVFLFFFSTVCYAGDIPECLLIDEEAQVYFGEVKSEEAEAERVAQLEKRAEPDTTAEGQKGEYAATKNAAKQQVPAVDSKWNWINIFGLILVALMLVPNIIFAMRFRDLQNQCTNRVMNVLEQVGRYGSMFFMVVNVFGEYGFSSLGALLVYMLGNGVLLLAYWIIWMLYFVKQQAWKGMALAILPTLIFLISGIALRYVLLVITAVIFAVSHIYVTWQNVKGDVQ